MMLSPPASDRWLYFKAIDVNLMIRHRCHMLRVLMLLACMQIERVPQLQVVRSTNKGVSSGELLDAESEHAKLHHTAVHTLSSTAHKGWTGIAMVTVLPVVVNKKVWGSLAFYKHKGEQVRCALALRVMCVP